MEPISHIADSGKIECWVEWTFSWQSMEHIGDKFDPINILIYTSNEILFLISYCILLVFIWRAQEVLQTLNWVERNSAALGYIFVVI